MQKPAEKAPPNVSHHVHTAPPQHDLYNIVPHVTNTVFKSPTQPHLQHHIFPTCLYSIRTTPMLQTETARVLTLSSLPPSVFPTQAYTRNTITPCPPSLYSPTLSTTYGKYVNPVQISLNITARVYYLIMTPPRP